MTIREIGLAIVRNAPWLERIGRWVYGRLPELLRDTPTSRLRAGFARESRVTFVQIGANDGVTNDPLRPLIVDGNRWRGILVEPQPDIFERLRRNYGAQASQLEFVNAAISDGSGDKTLFCVPEAERHRLGLPDWVTGIASFNVEHMRRHLDAHSLRDVALVGCRVPTITFAEVAARLPGGYVDAVVVDVEGHERAIIESIDLDRHRIKFIIYEHVHLSASDRSWVECKLRKHRFSVAEIHSDTIASRFLEPLN